MKIAVLCGGISPERDVSLSTGSQVAMALKKKGHSVALIDSAADYPDGFDALFTAEARGAGTGIGESAPDISSLLTRGGYFGKNVVEILKSADIVFNAMHGAAGEDGTLQASLDLMGIKYTGSGAKGCSVSMDKTVTKRMLAPVKNVRMPRGIHVMRDEFGLDPQNTLKTVITEVGLPLVVKPACGGSSVGVSIVNDAAELKKAFELSLSYEPKAVVEEFVDGREFSCGVLGDTALPPIEIKPRSGFYDYRNKYQQGLTEEICPAHISERAANEMKLAALTVHRELGLSAYSRTDFRMTSDGVIYALEANTLPGMTAMSLIPQEAAAVGIGFGELCETIIAESLKKYDKA
ncbi:MAG: D-alanine--D-alanine ligase [Clostridia bacterium]|nr:D-alanine--D-alanine ligase [Clostridia bacterium]